MQADLSGVLKDGVLEATMKTKMGKFELQPKK